MRVAGILAMVAAAAAVGSAPVAAQTGIAQVRIDATVRMPEILRLLPGDTETIQDGGDVVTRSTVYVSANRAWTLTAVVQGEGVSDVIVEGDSHGDVVAHAETQTVSGRNGNLVPVVVEVRRAASAGLPQLQWVLLPQ